MDLFFTCWLGFMAVLFGVAMLRGLKKSEALRQHGCRTQGVVVRNKIIWGRITVVRPVVRFSTASGQVVEAVDYSGWASAFPRFAKGQKVAILYDEHDPTQFERA